MAAMMQRPACSAVAQRASLQRGRSLAAGRAMCVARPQASRSTTDAGLAQPVVTSKFLGAASAAVLPALLASPAIAAGGSYGILEGRTAALIHPAVEFVLLGSTLYAGYLGWQWRRTRELGEEIRALKSAAPAPTGDAPAPPNPVIEAKEKERKALMAGGFRDKHFVWGSLLLAAGVGIAIAGAANTFIRTGKLFPGPHLFAGATIVSLWALAASLVPAMQKGDNNARNAHIALNAIQVGLFLWQVPTGLEIVGKVFEFTQWP